MAADNDIVRIEPGLRPAARQRLEGLDGDRADPDKRRVRHDRLADRVLGTHLERCRKLQNLRGFGAANRQHVDDAELAARGFSNHG
jgi:hypothetical protein